MGQGGVEEDPLETFCPHRKTIQVNVDGFLVSPERSAELVVDSPELSRLFGPLLSWARNDLAS
jgi:hypothetical protein